METDWELFGDKHRFAFEYRFQPDPDHGQAATPLESSSWGEFRLWVRGQNMCHHHHKGEFHQEVTWYLSPLLCWLAEHWDPLFHEEQFPLPCDKSNARVGYLDSLRRTMGDTDPAMEAKGERWFGWWQRHALRSCRQGGLFPDLFFRRMVDFSEISWGNSRLEGVDDDFYFSVPFGNVTLPIEQVTEPLLEGLQSAVTCLKEGMATAADAELNLLVARVKDIDSQGQLTQRLNWYAGNLSRLGNTIRSSIQEIIHPEEGVGFIRRLSPAVAMFGSLAPNIPDTDLDLIIPAYIQAHSGKGDTTQLQPLVSRDAEFPENDPFDAGYDAALDFLEAINGKTLSSGQIDIRDICRSLGVRIDDVILHDSNIRGVAFAGDSVTPTILINTAHRYNQQEEGQRFSIGHELCHILHDRFFGGEVSIASGPWAPAAIEKRANAFSAMLLMPLDLINASIGSRSLDTSEGIDALAKQLGVSKKALLWHLYNLGKLDEEQIGIQMPA